MFSVEDEISFWGRQMAEHLLFIRLGLVEEALKEVPRQKINGQYFNLREEATIYYNQWMDLLAMSPYDIQAVKDLILTTRNYKERFLTLLVDGVWIGYTPAAAIQHMLKELSYFWGKITGEKYTLSDEIYFWLNHHETETAFVDKLLDPTEETLSSDLHDYIQRLRNLSPKELSAPVREALEEFYDLNRMLEDEMLAKELLSIIAPELIRHIIREAERALQTLQ